MPASRFRNHVQSPRIVLFCFLFFKRISESFFTLPFWGAELLGFIRYNIGFFVGVLSILGYVLYHPPSLDIIPIFIVSFCLISSTYAYNNMTDRVEDLVNRKRINYFSRHAEMGYSIILAFFMLGLVVSSTLGKITFLVYVLLSALGFIYSFRRIKKIVLMKNVYTTLLAGVFLMGAAVDGSLSFSMLLYTSLIGFVIFIGSILSDLRDQEGDARASIQTLPVLLGEKKVTLFLLILVNVFFIVCVVFRLRDLYVLAFFMIPIIEFISIREIQRAHKMIQYSFLLMLAWWLP